MHGACPCRSVLPRALRCWCELKCRLMDMHAREAEHVSLAICAMCAKNRRSGLTLYQVSLWSLLECASDLSAETEKARRPVPVEHLADKRLFPRHRTRQYRFTPSTPRPKRRRYTTIHMAPDVTRDTATHPTSPCRVCHTRRHPATPDVTRPHTATPDVTRPHPTSHGHTRRHTATPDVTPPHPTSHGAHPDPRRHRTSEHA